MSTVRAAADLTRRGLAVFALPPGGRRPAAPGWVRRCLTTPAQVVGHWRDGDNIGVACRPSRMVGVDVDGPAGVERLAELCADAGQSWPVTFTVDTPHGRHLYFAAPPGVVIGSASGDRSPLGPGVDLRGPGRRTGGYLIGPGSTVDGVVYRIREDAPLAPLPEWVQRICILY